MHDAIIVGGGPAGSLAARSLADKKYDVLVLEDHVSPGLPMHCTGLVSDETIRMSGVRPDIINTLYGAEFIFPSGQSVTVRSKKPKARLIDRVDLDKKLAQSAMNAGARFSFSDKYISHTVGDEVSVESDTGAHRAKVIIGADGASSAVAMSLGENRPKEYIRGIQADVNYTMEDQDLFKVYVGNNIAPGFFAWEVPCGGFTRIGLCTSWSVGAPSEYLSKFLINKGLQDKVMQVYSGKIPLGGRQFISGDRCLLVGDAAGFVKPLSGGGLNPAFRANEHLVNTLMNGMDSDALFARDLLEYDKACSGDFGKELDRSYSLRKRFKKMSDNDFNKVYDYVMKNDLVPMLNEFDIDHPTNLIKEITSKPKAMISALPLMLRAMK